MDNPSSRAPSARRGRRVVRWTPYFLIGTVAFVVGSATGQRQASHITTSAAGDYETDRVTGIGGVFFRSTDPAETRNWYRTHLGIDAADWGGFAFRWQEQDQPEETGYTVWGVFSDTTEYFGPGDQSYMLNYRVADLTGLIDALRQEGVEIAGEIEQHPNGKFAWIVDPEGRRIELWEPVPSNEDPYLK